MIRLFVQDRNTKATTLYPFVKTPALTSSFFDI